MQSTMYKEQFDLDEFIINNGEVVMEADIKCNILIDAFFKEVDKLNDNNDQQLYLQEDIMRIINEEEKLLKKFKEDIKILIDSNNLSDMVNHDIINDELTMEKFKYYRECDPEINLRFITYYYSLTLFALACKNKNLNFMKVHKKTIKDMFIIDNIGHILIWCNNFNVYDPIIEFLGSDLENYKQKTLMTMIKYAQDPKFRFNEITLTILIEHCTTIEDKHKLGSMLGNCNLTNDGTLTVNNTGNPTYYQAIQDYICDMVDTYNENVNIIITKEKRYNYISVKSREELSKLLRGYIEQLKTLVILATYIDLQKQCAFYDKLFEFICCTSIKETYDFLPLLEIYNLPFYNGVAEACIKIFKTYIISLKKYCKTFNLKIYELKCYDKLLMDNIMMPIWKTDKVEYFDVIIIHIWDDLMTGYREQLIEQIDNQDNNKMEIIKKYELIFKIGKLFKPIVTNSNKPYHPPTPLPQTPVTTPLTNNKETSIDIPLAPASVPVPITEQTDKQTDNPVKSVFSLFSNFFSN